LGREDHPPGTHLNGVLASIGIAAFPTIPTYRPQAKFKDVHKRG